MENKTNNGNVLCFVCFKELECLFKSDDNIYKGTSLDFVGNYGSEYDMTFSRIYICDSCVSSRVGTIIDLQEYSF